MADQPSSGISRRDFLKGTGLAAASALAAPYIVPSSVFGANAPSNRVTLGFIGTGRQAYCSNIPQFLTVAGVQVTALCDVDTWRLGQTR